MVSLNDLNWNRLLNRGKKAAATEAETLKGDVVKRRGLLGKLGMKKKSKAPVPIRAEKPVEDDTVEDTMPAREEEAAPAGEEPTPEPLEPEAAKKEEEEEPADEDDKEEQEDPAEDPAEERDEDIKEDEPVAEEPDAEEQLADAEAAPVVEEGAEIEEREQPEPTTPRTSQSTGFLCGCL
jgi:hypothetical protein